MPHVYYKQYDQGLFQDILLGHAPTLNVLRNTVVNAPSAAGSVSSLLDTVVCFLVCTRGSLIKTLCTVPLCRHKFLFLLLANLCRMSSSGSVSSLQCSGVKPVVVLDEVTSSLDSVTESTIHRIIDDEFTEKGHTVIIVAHRLGAMEKHTKIGRDALALMADGQLQEVIEDLGPVVFQRFRQLE